MKAPVSLAAIVLAVAAPVQAQETKALETNVARFSYGVGLQIGTQLKNQGMDDLDAEAIAIAIDDVLNGRDMRVSMEDMRAAATAYQNERKAERMAEGEKAQAAGEKFLAENRGREGVIALDSGLQYRVVESGNGDSPTETDTVLVHYRGRLLDGTEFDSSYGRGQPTELGVGQVIPGWQQALQLMHVGSVWEVWIPSSLAYGEQGAGSIGPNETLHFQIELVEIKG